VVLNRLLYVFQNGHLFAARCQWETAF